MTAYKGFLIAAAIAFFIGALMPVFRAGAAPNWTDLGLGFATVAFILVAK